MTKQKPKFNRQRLLLFLLEAAGGKLSKMDFQKLLFLAHQDSELKYYDFVPYHYGCYSFQASSDLEVLEQRGWIQSDERNLTLVDKPYMGTGVKLDERKLIARLMYRYKTLRGDTLVKTVYKRSPYYAINSKMADRLLDAATISKIEAERVAIQSSKPQMFSIGYEGITFEGYVNKLLRNNIKLLCDVRKNPLSRKFGFSKGTLSTLLPKLGIEYVHIPELGIVSDKRQKLETLADYQRLFKEYSAALPSKAEQLDQLNRLFKQYGRIAVTCYEEDPRYCHRTRIADYLHKKHDIGVTTI